MRRLRCSSELYVEELKMTLPVISNHLLGISTQRKAVPQVCWLWRHSNLPNRKSNLSSSFLPLGRYHPPQPLPRSPPPPRCPLARLTVALPLANPTPRPFEPLDLNIGAFLFRSAQLVWSFTSLPDLVSAARNSWTTNVVPSRSMDSKGKSFVPQHIRHNEKPHVAAPNIDLFQM